MINKLTYSLLLLLFFTACREKQAPKSEQFIAPVSIEGLRQKTFEAHLVFEKKLEDSKKWEADLWSYFSDSLKIYALVNTPKTKAPKEGFPILIFGHGFHPEPKKYGVSNKTGKDWRPGDYYRGIPEGYAENGYLVVTPDYRGHNVSDGFEYTKKSFLASSFYARDVLHLLAGLKDLKNADLSNVFYMGHSMGGDVGLKMLLATDQIKAASLWAGVSATTWEQALYYGKYYDTENDKTDTEIMKEYMARLDTVIQNLGYELDIDSVDPIHFLEDISMPLIIHHARGENSVPYIWSESLAAKLYKHGKPFEFYAYDSDNHLFKDTNRVKALERDLKFFKKYK